jgi:hypothetical protein
MQVLSPRPCAESHVQPFSAEQTHSTPSGQPCTPRSELRGPMRGATTGSTTVCNP